MFFSFLLFSLFFKKNQNEVNLKKEKAFNTGSRSEFLAEFKKFLTIQHRYPVFLPGKKINDSFMSRSYLFRLKTIVTCYNCLC